MCFGPQAREIGKVEARQRLTVVRRLCGQHEMSPRGVLAQSIDRTSAPISPPPTSQSPGRSWSRTGERRALAFFVPRFFTIVPDRGALKPLLPSSLGSIARRQSQEDRPEG